MNPALSVIFFTVVSGMGYGLLFVLGVGLAFDAYSVSRNESLIVLATGAVFAAAGLSSSLLHLGQPQRAWRALSQWRSSWLSREGVASLLSFAPLLVLGLAIWHGANANAIRAVAALLAAMAVVTICCTAKIYTSLKTIRAWHNPHVLPGYLLFALLGGTAWLWALASITDAREAPWAECLPPFIAVLAAVCAVLKRRYWIFIDTMPAISTTESATGLGRFGSVRGVEAPHTEENYLTHEMGFALARKHATRLRLIALTLFAAAPVVVVALALVTRSPLLIALCAGIAALGVTAGTFVERWLFFAEAKHVVMLYYGARDI